MGTLVTNLHYGSYDVNLTYLGDDNFNINSTKLSFTIVEPSKENTSIVLDVKSVENNVTFTVNVNPDATGLVKFVVSGAEEYNLYVDVTNGKAILDDVLTTGNYTVSVIYMGDLRFNSNITSSDFTVVGHVKKDTPISASVKVNGYRVTIGVSVDSTAIGFVKIKLDDAIVNIELTNGVGSLITNLVAGSYHADLTYLGDDDFNPNSTKVLFTVVDPVKENIPINLNVGTVGNNVTFTVNVDSAATCLVKFVVSGVEEYTLYANVVGGKTILEDVLAAGNYTVVATYLGDAKFNANVTSKEFELSVLVKKDTFISVLLVTQGNNVNITVNVEDDAQGLVELSINGNSVYLKV